MKKNKPMQSNNKISRRTLLGGGVAMAVGLSSAKAKTRKAEEILTAPSVVSDPPRQWGIRAPAAFTPDPDIITYDAAFKDVLYTNAALTQAWRGDVQWLEGPAWSNEGRFLLLSDVTGSTQYRYSPDDRHMSVFRKESYNSNGNTFDAEGRIITCEHGLRRVIRWEHDGTCRVIADRFDGHHLNSPNDVVVNRDGSIWFTDPAYGDMLWEGHPDAPPGAANRGGRYKWDLDAEVVQQIGGMSRQKDHVFRYDPVKDELKSIISQEEVAGPNGLCFSPDHKQLYVVSTAKAPGQEGPGGDRNIYVFDVSGDKLEQKRLFCTMTLNGHQLMPDGIRADIFGNLWCGATGPLGLAGVFIYSPSGKLIGRLRLPHGISNLTFGGPKRDRLFMCAANALYTLDVNTQGAGLA